MKKKAKPTSVRLDYELLEELDQRCEKVGCSRNDFIKNAVELVITTESKFDFGDDEEMNETEEEKQISKQEQSSEVTGIIITDVDTGQKWVQGKDGILQEIERDSNKAKIILHSEY